MEWKDYLGNNLKIGDFILYAGRYSSLSKAIVSGVTATQVKIQYPAYNRKYNRVTRTFDDLGYKTKKGTLYNAAIVAVPIEMVNWENRALEEEYRKIQFAVTHGS